MSLGAQMSLMLDESDCMVLNDVQYFDAEGTDDHHPDADSKEPSRANAFQISTSMRTPAGVPYVFWHEAPHQDFESIDEFTARKLGIRFFMEKTPIHGVGHSDPCSMAAHLLIHNPATQELLKEYASELEIPFSSDNPIASLDDNGRLLRYVKKNGHDGIVCHDGLRGQQVYIAFDLSQIMELKGSEIDAALDDLKKCPNIVKRVRR